MEISGEHHFNAPRELVWDALLDAAAIESAIPGCERFEATAPDAYDVTLKVGIAAIKGTYAGEVRVADEQPCDSYRLIVSGNGRPGSVQGEATLTLSDNTAGTVVRYHGTVRAQGAIARVGSRLLAGTAKLLIGQFFKGMDAEVQRRVP